MDIPNIPGTVKSILKKENSDWNLIKKMIEVVVGLLFIIGGMSLLALGLRMIMLAI